MATKKNDVVVKEKSLVVNEEEVKDLSIFAVEEGEEEHLSQDELEMPFLKLGQKMTKVEIEGLVPGLYYNTVSEKVYGKVIKVQVHGYFHNFTKWKGPKGNGEFRGTMSTTEFREFEKVAEPPLTNHKGDMVHKVDNEDIRYTDTHNFIVSLPDYPEEGIMIYPLTSTGCKVARKWNSLNNARRVQGRPAKRYATIWELETDGFISNEGGFAYKQVKHIKVLGWVNAELNDYGKSFEDFVKVIKDQGVKYSDEGTATEDAEESEY
jgi:hypothetical protein